MAEEKVTITIKQEGKEGFAFIDFTLDENSTATMNLVFEPEIDANQNDLYAHLAVDVLRAFQR